MSSTVNQPKNDLFKDVKYYVTGNIESEIQKLLEDGGAISTKIMFTNITHLLCGADFDEKDIGEATDIYDIPSVTGEWVKASVQLGRLASPKIYHPIPNGLFTPITAAIIELSDNDRKKLYTLIRFYGGRIDRNIHSKTTHLVCGLAAGSTYKTALAIKSDKFNIVTPDWFYDCLKVQNLIDEKPYHPRLLKSDATGYAINDERTLSSILGLDDVKIDQENNIQDTNSQIKIKCDNNNVASITPISNASISTASDDISKSVENIFKANESSVKSNQYETKIEQQQMLPQMSTAKASIVTTPTVSIQTQLLQKQLEQPLKSENINILQNHKTLPQIQQFQVQQKNQTAPTLQQTSLAGDQNKNEQQNQINAQKQMNNSTNQQIISHMSNAPNQIQVQQIQPNNQLQQIGIDQSGQIQFMSSITTNSNNFNAIQPNQQMKVVHNVQQQQLQQSTQQFIVQSPGTNKAAILNQNVVFINQSGQQQSITSNQQPVNNVVQQQRNITSPMIQGQQILIHSSVQQPNQNQMLQSPQQIIVQTSPGQGASIISHSPNQRIQKTPNQVATANWYLQQQQQQQHGQTLNQTTEMIQNIQQKVNIQQNSGPAQQVSFSNIRENDIDANLPQSHNQTVMLAGNQSIAPQSNQISPVQQQGILQGQGLVQKMHVQNQQIVLASSPPQQHCATQMQSLSPQQQKIQSQPQVNSTPGQTQYIRATRPQWQGNQQGPQRQLIHLDAQTHAILQSLEPIQRAEYLSKLQKRNFLFRQQQQGFIQQGNAVGVQQRPSHIITRPQVQGSQMQWITPSQQQQQRPVLVRTSAPGLSPISQQIIGSSGNVTNQSSPVQQQFSIESTSQFQRIQIQQTPGQKLPTQNNIVVPIQNADQQTTNQTAGTVQQQISSDGTTQVQMKTKTALANMLSNRINSGNNGTILPMQTDAQPIEPSASGTLRMITAQHNAPNVQGQQQFQIDPNIPPQFQRIHIQQATAPKILSQGNLIVAQKPFPENEDQQKATNQMTSIVQLPSTIESVAQMNKTKPVVIQTTACMKSPPFSPNRSLARPQFYGHNPNLKLPPELFLVGCIFYVVEYDESHASELPEWKKLIQHHGGEVESIYCRRVTHVLCRTQRHGVVMQAIRESKRCVTAYWLNDTILKMQVQPPSEALHLPMPSTFGTQRPAIKHIISLTGFEGDERSRIKQMVEESGALLTPYFSRHNSILICKKLEGNKYKRAKDWAIPVVNCVWLSDILQGNLSHMSQYDQAKYQQYNLTAPLRIDYTLVAHLMTAWKSPINLKQDSYERVKRLLADPPSNEPKAKKVRMHEPLEILPDEIVCKEKPINVPRILFSQVDNLEGLKKAVLSLSGEVVADEKDATHLVLTNLMRTYKLLFALCTVDHIVSSKWIVDSAKAGKFLRSDEYILNDDQFIKTYNCDIQEVIKSTTRKTLFSGKTFYVTPSVRPKQQDVIKLIEFCGGKVEPKRRSASQILLTNAQNPESYIILTCTKDLHLVHDLTRLDKSNRFICSTELVLTAIMHQKIDLEPHIITYDRSKS